MPPTQAVVVGAGVLGLTSALYLRKKGYAVTVLARELPEDAASQSFASPWAGANWCSFARNNMAERRWDEYTYKQFQKLAKELPEDLLTFMPFTCYDVKPNDTETYWFGEVCGGIREEYAPKHPAAAEAPYMYKFRSLTLDAPRYLRWLATQVTCPGGQGPPGKIERVTTLRSLKTAVDLVPRASLVVNATGLGSQDIPEAAETQAYPIRGQTVLVHAPRFRDANVAHCASKISSQGASYVIPRARSGYVILGGTFHKHVSNPLTPDQQVTERILKDAVQLAPDLLPEHVRADDADAWKSLDVVGVNIGVRPARAGGARVALDEQPLEMHGRRVGVIHAYGIGPAGYQASHGIAAEVCDWADRWEAQARRAHL